MMDEAVDVKWQSHLRSIALPSQHGAWGFLFEPIILGLLVAPSWVSLLLGAAIVSTFLIQRPLVIVVKDLRRKRCFARTRIATLIVLVFASLAFLLFALTVISVGIVFVPPLILALPLAVTQMWL